MSIKIQALLASVVLLAACNKKDDPQLPPPPPSGKYDVITTATLFNPANTHYEAAYFINQDRTILDAGGSEQSFAYGIEKNGNNLYIAGAFAKESTEPGGDDVLMPCYWRNNHKVDLPVIGLDISYRCGASDAKWFNGMLFLVGDADLAPVLWRMETPAPSITQFGFEQDVVAVRKTGNMQVYNGKLYIGGNQKKMVNGKAVYNAGYWTVDQNDQMEFHTVEGDLDYALCFSISVSDKGVFLAGEAGAADHPSPTVWSTQGRLPVSNSFNASVHRLHTAGTDSKGNLFLNVFDIQSYQPVVWKVPSTGQHSLIKASVPAGSKGFCQAIDIKDDQLAYSYLYQLGNNFTAAYVFEGKTVTLDVNNSRLSELNYLKVFRR